MIYNTIANGNNTRQENTYVNRSSSNKSHNQKGSIYDNNINKERHVTFRIDNRHADQIIYPKNKPQYHFAYGQSFSNPSAQQIQAKAHNRNNSYSVQPKFQTFYDEFSIGKAPKQLSPAVDRSRSESRRKKRLKIFPQKYQSNDKISKKIQQKDEVLELKNQIGKLKLQIRNLSQNISKNTSRDLSQAQVYRNEAERTRRLSQLSVFNERLYQEMAGKLKQISLAQYENYLQQNNTNRMFLDSVYSSAKKSNINQDSGHKRSKYSENFIDIKDFQKEYQRKYQSTGLQNIMKNTDFVPKVTQTQTDQIESPFLLKQNMLEAAKWDQRFDETQPKVAKNSEKAQAFTFHKQKQYQQRLFSQPFKQVDNNPFIRSGQHEKIQVKKKKEIEEKQRNKRFKQKLQSQTKINVQVKETGPKQIDDFNRQLENKIQRKKVNSQYSYLTKARKY